MKKLLVFPLCIIICIIFTACTENMPTGGASTGEQTDTSTEDIGSICDVITPLFFNNDAITIVELGEKCEWIEGFPYPEGKSCYSVNYIHAFGFTFESFDWEYDEEEKRIPEIKYVSDLKNNLHRLPYHEEGFKYIKNGNELMENYYDIIMLSDFQAENVTPGDGYIIAAKLTVFDRWEGEEHIIYAGYRDVTKGYMYPILNDRLDISDMFDELYVRNPGANNDLLHDILEANELISEKNPDFPIFEDGSSISDLERYFQYGGEIFYDNFWREVNGSERYH